MTVSLVEAADFTTGLAATFGRSFNSSEMRRSKSPFSERVVVTSLTMPSPFHEPAINRDRIWRSLHAANLERAKLSRRDSDILFADDAIMLMHLGSGDVTVEIPARSGLQRRRDHDLRRVELGHFAILIDPRRANDSVLIHREKVSVCDYAVAMHFKFQKIFAIDVCRTINPVNHEELNLSISVRC